MDALALVLVSGACLLLAYLTYARWLSRRVFALRDDAITPATEFEDDADYVPTKKSIIFGHHFTSIAGTGPIVGPAIAVMWGWLPAILWVVLGSIFVGAVHDLGSLVVSLRNKGRSIGDIAGDLLGPRARFIFLLILIMGLWIVLAIFGLVVAAVLSQYPSAIFPVVIQIPIALAIGLLIHRKGRSIVLPSIVALSIMYASVVWGDVGILHEFNTAMAALPTWAWVAGLLLYAYVASVLPVWTLLQPRDYINALQLITSLGVLVVGLLVASTLGGAPDDTPVIDTASTNVAAHEVEPLPGGRPELNIVAPMIDWQPIGAPPMLPVLFITIACGACSGFHCLVGSGTTSKQISKETDATAVGYGSMVTEGFLATLVIVACVAGLGLGNEKLLQYGSTMYPGAMSANADPTAYERVHLYTTSTSPTRQPKTPTMGFRSYFSHNVLTGSIQERNVASVDTAPPLSKPDVRFMQIHRHEDRLVKTVTSVMSKDQTPISSSRRKVIASEVIRSPTTGTNARRTGTRSRPDVCASAMITSQYVCRSCPPSTQPTPPGRKPAHSARRSAPSSRAPPTSSPPRASRTRSASRSWASSSPPSRAPPWTPPAASSGTSSRS